MRRKKFDRTPSWSTNAPMPAYSIATKGVISSNLVETLRIREGLEPVSRNQLLPRQVRARQNVLQGDEIWMSMQTLSPSRATCGSRAINSRFVISRFRYAK